MSHDLSVLSVLCLNSVPGYYSPDEHTWVLITAVFTHIKTNYLKSWTSADQDVMLWLRIFAALLIACLPLTFEMLEFIPRPNFRRTR